MEKFKEEDRARLMMFENQYRHEHKREKYLKDGQEQRDRKKQASMEKKSARQQKKIMMESWVVMEVCTEGPARGERVCLHPGKPCADYLEPNPETAGSPGHSACKTDRASVDNREQTVVVESEIVNEVQPEDTKLGEHQRLLPARPHMKHPDPHTDTTNLHGHQACKVDQKQASVLRECAIQKKKSQGKIILTEESKRIEECVNDTGNPDEKFPEAPWQKHQPRSSQPERLCTELPALQSSLAKIYGNKGIRVDQRVKSFQTREKVRSVGTEEAERDGEGGNEISCYPIPLFPREREPSLVHPCLLFGLQDPG
ncbi:uncharacterized protein LOC133135173 [Conger conger]|uniref:uncharacterized protein LOC133135173 n=1 Tax=Conger conger TaxID=82655 RepID=UPI002A5A93BA|nr:uncharacterized protein LOC133135173 [Conger conger]